MFVELMNLLKYLIKQSSIDRYDGFTKVMNPFPFSAVFLCGKTIFALLICVEKTIFALLICVEKLYLLSLFVWKKLYLLSLFV